MKVALICPSNKLFMPYVSNYVLILKDIGVEYKVINWDRFQIEELDCSYIYRDAKIGHQRNFWDYYKYVKFIINKLNETAFDKIIIFGLQLSFFLKKLLSNQYKGNFVIDIRDYNKIIKLFNINKLIDKSKYVVISSPNYKSWLPDSNNYITNHNTQITHLEDLKAVRKSKETKKINIAFIGAIRDYEINIELIKELKNNCNVSLNFHGEGDINKQIEDYIKLWNINNVFLTGRYLKSEEERLYSNSDIINVLRYSDDINNKTALPNRLYNSAFYGKPMLCFGGSYLADLIEKYNLGLVIKSFDNLDEIINNYFENINIEEYELGRERFFKEVIKENDDFKEKLLEFLDSK